MLSREELNKRLRYDPETGLLFWRERENDGAIWHESWNARMAGKQAGVRHSSGRIFMSLENRKFYAHRVIWKMVHGTEPPEIDHINGDPSDNRLVNLRAATREQNMRNIADRNRKHALPRGVTVDRKGLIYARIHVNKKLIHLGCFKTVEDASAAYRAASLTMHGEFSALRRPA